MIIDYRARRRHTSIKQVAAIFVLATISATMVGLNVIALGSVDSCIKPIAIAPTATTTNIREKLEGKEYRISMYGTVNANNIPTTTWFEYGTSESMNTNTGYIYVGQKNVEISVNIESKEIRQNTKYWYRIVSENNYGKTYGKTLTFKTI